jgi:hypothetical protein
MKGAMRQMDQRVYRTIYRTFEEFEREELRRSETVSASVGDDDLVATVFGEELDFEPAGQRRPAQRWNDDEE